MTPNLPRSAVEPRLRQEVLDWFVRRHREAWSAEEEAAFTAWLEADADHRAAYAQWSAQWTALDSLPADTVARLRRHLARDPTPPRRAFLVPAFSLAALAAVAVGTGYVAWTRTQAEPLFVQAFSTGRGQQMDVPLPDGSRLRLDTATRVEIRYYRQHREARLLDGQVFVIAHPEAARPFQVLAGPLRVTVVGTRFAVRHTPGFAGAEGVTVSVEEGRVQVQQNLTGGDAPAAVGLSAGQQVASDAQGLLGPVSRVPSDGIAPWREHRVSFVDMPLARALAELDRYGNTGLVVRDPAVAELRLTGTFDPRDAATLRRLLPGALPVRLQEVGGVTELIPAR